MRNHLGKNMKHALDFIGRVNGWHTFNKRERATVEAIKRLEKQGLIETNQFSQFRSNPNRGQAFLNHLMKVSSPLI